MMKIKRSLLISMSYAIFDPKFSKSSFLAKYRYFGEN